MTSDRSSSVHEKSREVLRRETSAMKCISSRKIRHRLQRSLKKLNELTLSMEDKLSVIHKRKNTSLYGTCRKFKEVFVILSECLPIIVLRHTSEIQEVNYLNKLISEFVSYFSFRGFI